MKPLRRSTKTGAQVSPSTAVTAKRMRRRSRRSSAWPASDAAQTEWRTGPMDGELGRVVKPHSGYSSGLTCSGDALGCPNARSGSRGLSSSATGPIPTRLVRSTGGLVDAGCCQTRRCRGQPAVAVPPWPTRKHRPGGGHVGKTRNRVASGGSVRPQRVRRGVEAVRCLSLCLKTLPPAPAGGTRLRRQDTSAKNTRGAPTQQRWVGRKRPLLLASCRCYFGRKSIISMLLKKTPVHCG